VRLRHWILPLSILVSLTQVSLAQTDNWAVVSQLLSHQKVKVVTNDGRSHVGIVELVTEDQVRIGKQLLQKEDVQQVLLWSPGHHGRNALIGLASGAGFGVAVGVSCGGKDAFVSKGQCMAVGAPLFGGVGAGIGALLPSSGHWREVYRALKRSDTTQ
jgi:hypothetical protein